MKYLGMNLICTRSDEKIQLNKWREIPRSWIRRLNIVKMPVFPNPIYKFNAIPVKIPMSHFVGNNRLILKFI